MVPGILLCSMCPGSHPRKKTKKNGCESLEPDPKDLHFWHSAHFNRDPPRFALRSQTDNLSRRNGDFCRTKRSGEMTNKVSNFSDLIQRVTASCLLHPLAAGRQDISGNRRREYETDEEEEEEEENEEEERGEYRFVDALDEGEKGKEETIGIKKSKMNGNRQDMTISIERVREMEAVMEEVFESAAAMKKAYVALQDAHSPWDPQRMHDADVAVVAEMRRIGVLKEQFKRMAVSGGGRRRENGGGGGVGFLREAVAPYEAALKDLKREVKVKDMEIENLKEKLKTVSSVSNGGKKGRSMSSRKVSCATQVWMAPVPELFEATMIQVKEASKSFTTFLLSLMRSAHWDIAAAVRSIEAASAVTDSAATANAAAAFSFVQSSVPTQHAKFALESYISRKIFQGFDHETFYMDGSLSSLLDPGRYRHECFNQYKDMKSMDPIELLGILPTCHFGKFCSKKYLSIVHPKMEESFFGNSEQRQAVLAGNHPRTRFYEEFLGLAKAIWLLHLLAFSMDPSPNHFEASRGAEFHPRFMESVVRFSDGRVPAGQAVGFAVSPGFKLGSGSVVKARVYLVPRT